MKHFTIFQLNENVKNSRNYMFMSLDFLAENDMELSLDLYEQVYNGEVDAKDGQSMTEVLEKIYTTFNIYHPADFKGHSLSTSDIVMIDGKYYYCDEYGWEEVFKKQTIEVQVEEINDGQHYFSIYEVCAQKIDTEEIVTIHRFLSRDEAEENKELSRKVHSERYKTFWVREGLVWC